MTSAMLKNVGAIVAIVILGASLSMAQQNDLRSTSDPAMTQSVTGTITCEWRVTHLYQCRRYQTQQTCTLDCVQQGSRFSLVAADSFYRLDGDHHLLERYAGGKATIMGAITRNSTDGTLTLHAVSARPADRRAETE